MHVLSLDGGQSSTICVLGTPDGTIMSAGHGGPANHIAQPGGPQRLERALRSSVSEALATAGLPADSVSTAYLSLTGGVSLAMELMPSILPAGRVLAESDTIAALASGTRGGPGVGIICGTGSSAVAVNAAGERIWRGGWGYLLGDEGSGYWVGLQALQAAARAEDGRGPATVLREQVLQRFAAPPPRTGTSPVGAPREAPAPPSLRDVAARVYAGEIERPQIAALAPLVLAATDAGDGVAAGIVDRAAEELAALVDCTCAAARFSRDDERVIVPAGGLLRPGNALWRRFAAAIETRLPAFRLAAPEFPPVIGAYLLALRLAGVPADEAVLDRIRATVGGVL